MLKYIRRRRNRILHMTAAFVGGGTGIYAVMMRGNFGQAQTVNLIDLFEHWITWKDPVEILYRFIAFALFIFALAITHFLRVMVKKDRIEMLCYIVEACCVLAAGTFPADAPEIPALFPIFFMTGFQWGVFSGADGFNCSTIFCTNNCRQALYGWMDYASDHKERSREQGIFYTCTIAFFYTGVVFCGLACVRLGIRAIWFELAPLAFAVVIWFLSGSVKTDEEKPFAEGEQNLRRGSDEL